MNGVLKLDWLGFTFVPDKDNDLSPIEQFINAFPEFDSTNFVVASVKSHYQHSVYYDDILISYNDLFDCDCESTYLHKLNMGVNVQVPAHCLSQLYAMLDVKLDCYYDLFTLLILRRCRFSRIDLCFDDYDKVFTAGYYINKMFKIPDRPMIRSPFIKSVTALGADSQQGQTIYFGSLKKRSKLLRIYDKYAQSKGVVDAVRYEFEHHGADAAILVDSILNDDEYKEGFPFCSYLKKWIIVLDEDSVRNSSNDKRYREYAKIDEEWDKCFNSQFNAKILVNSEESEALNLAELTHYCKHIGLKQFAGYANTFGMNALIKLIDDAIEHEYISDKYLRYANKFKHCSELFDESKYFHELNVADYGEIDWAKEHDPLLRYNPDKYFN